MGYYENIAVCRTEKELLELWNAKEPVTKKLYGKKTAKDSIHKSQEYIYQ